MSALTAARVALAALLTEQVGEAWQVHRTVPEDLTGRDVVLQPASPYVKPDDEFLDVGDDVEVEQSVDIVVLVSADTNEGVHDAIDEALAAVVPALAGSAWHVTTTSRVQTFSTSLWTTYGMTLSVVRTTTLSTHQE